jgi:ATP-dependent DNA helicase RecQ
LVQQGFDSIKTFGIGRELPYTHWKSYITQFINKGIIAIDYTDQNKLKLTPLSKAVLQSKSKIELVEYTTPSKAVKKRVSKSAIIEDELFEELRKWRREKANEMNVPAYVIFSDATLKAIAEDKPIVAEDLSMIAGIGDIKKERFGEEIIEVIRSYLKDQNHTSKIKGSTHIETLHYLKEGLSVEEISLLRKLNTLTIYSHIAALYERGEAIDLTQWVNSKDLEIIGEHWNNMGRPEALKALFESLSGAYDYHKLRLAIAHKKKTG